MSLDPLLALHFLSSLVLFIPAIFGFGNFSGYLASISTVTGVATSTIYILLGLPTAIEQAQTTFRILSNTNLNFSPMMLLVELPAIFGLSLVILDVNLVLEVSQFIGLSETLIYILIALLPLSSIITA